MRPSLLPILLLLVPALADIRPRKPSSRNYDTHQYYTLEVDPSRTSLDDDGALALAKALGVELVEPLGELAGHWLVRTPGRTPLHNGGISSRDLASHHDRDEVVRRYHQSKRSSPLLRDIKSLTPLVIRKRSKRITPPPPSSHKRSLRHLSRSGPSGYDYTHERYTRADDTELLFAQNTIGLQDPMLNLQWHLINTEMTDVELNVTGLWSRGVTGKGVKVAIVDDGLDLNSDDLHENFYPEGSYDFNDHTELPLPRLSDDQHGTRCAGEIAAVPNNVCGVGVSYNAKIAGVRILSAPISDADEAAALNYGYQLNDIYSCSWGPPDDGRSMEAPEGVILKSMVNGVQQGRGGKGSVFVFAAGNGGGADDQCNFDGYTNSIFSITIGAVDRKGLHPYYSELCSAMMMVAPSSGSGDHIHTTDTGKDRCAHGHGGTSAAAPLAAGVFALALGARPELTWRDFQHIAVHTSVFFNPDDPDWEKTAVGRQYSYKYGYGRIDAGRFVELSETWKLVKPQAWFDSPAIYLPSASTETLAQLFPDRYYKHKRQEEATPAPVDDGTVIPGDQPPASNGDQPTEPTTPVEPPAPPKPEAGEIIPQEGITSTFEVTGAMLSESNFERLEHITVRVWITHTRRGDVEVELTSPNGITSVLARQRRFDEDTSGFPGWKFMSLKHWDENPIGTWTIKVKDQHREEHHGRLVAWSLQLWGECIDSSLAKNWAPATEGQPDEEVLGTQPSTTGTVSQKPKPTEHLPGDHGSAEGESDQPGLANPGGSTTGETDEDIVSPTPGAAVDEGFFDGIESLAKSSTWLAGAGMIIVLAGASIGVFFYFRNRKRNRNLFGLANNGEGARGAYAPVAEDVPMGLLERGRRKFGGPAGGTGAAVGAGAVGSKELYDAFGDGPSDESDDDDDGDGRRPPGLRYHDDFLEDEGEPPEYRDDDGGEEGEQVKSGQQGVGGRVEVQQSPEGSARGVESQSGSSGSWQDAAEDVRR